MLFSGRPDEEVFDALQPGLASDVVAACDVSLISDVQVPMDYTPFMPSKFVYQLFSDKPLVLYSKPGSPMWRAAEKYPSAGLFLADYTIPATLPSAIKRAVNAVFDANMRDCLRREFDKQTVAEHFISQLDRVL